MDLPQLPETIKKLYPFDSNYFEVDGHRMHYIDEGPRDAPVLVMVHGNPTWSFYYRNVVQAFSKSWRCIVPDHMGCGLSDKPQDYDYTLANHIQNMQSLMQSLDLGSNIVLMVHDWGGPIGLGWGLQNLDTLRGLILTNTAAFLMKQIPKRIAVCRIPFFGALAIQGLNAFAGAATMMATTQKGGLPNDVADGMVWPYDSWSNRVAVLRFVQDIPLSPKDRSYTVMKDIESQLHKFKDIPTKIFWGDKDFCFTPLFLQHWTQRLPEASVTRFPDAGHYVLEDAREEILAAMADFLPTCLHSEVDAR